MEEAEIGPSRRMMSMRKWMRRMAVLAAALAAPTARADVIFDSITPAPGSIPVRSYSTTAPFEYTGDGYVLTPGAATLTGIDLLGVNLTGTTFTAVRVNVVLWGAVNLGTVSAATPAFSNLLGSAAVAVGGVTSTLLDFERTPGVTPFITFTSPINLGTGVVGISLNLQGSIDGITYTSIPGLTPLVSTNAPPSVGSNPYSGFYVNKDSTGTTTGTDTNGNFTTGYTAFTSATGDAAPDQSLSIRLYGTINNTGPHAWASAGDGNWNSPSSWTPASVPTVTSDVTFNLSSPGYTVNVSTAQTAANIYLRSDRVTINFNTDSAALTASQSLCVGVPTTASPIVGSLILNRSFGTQFGRLVTNTVTDGGNGGVGNITVGNLTYLYATGPINVGPRSTIAVQPGGKLGAASLNLSGVADAWTSLVDLGTSALDLRAGNYNAAVNQIKQGLNAGGVPWQGSGGITSSTAAADTTHNTAVGVIVNSDAAGDKLYGTGGTLAATFDGDNPAASAVLIRYTYFGDANLDGKVDGSDYSLIDNGFLTNATGWYNGDFNYDGTIDGSDYSLIDNAYNRQGAPPQADAAPTAISAVVPEPNAAAAAVVVVLVGRGRRRGRFRAAGGSTLR